MSKAQPGSNSGASDINSQKDVEMADKSAQCWGRAMHHTGCSRSIQGPRGYCGVSAGSSGAQAYLVVPVASELQAVKPGSAPPLRELGWRDCS